jgi:Domain of unknown function (DU1801)
MRSLCLGDALFGYVNVFTSYVNVVFFHGAALPDPARLLQGTGKFMRHVLLTPGTATNAAALSRLIDAAYSDIKATRLSKRTEGYAEPFLTPMRRLSKLLASLLKDDSKTRMVNDFKTAA